MPPSNPVEANEAAVEAHVLRAVAKAWSWRRKLDAGKASTNLDLALVDEVGVAHDHRVRDALVTSRGAPIQCLR